MRSECLAAVLLAAAAAACGSDRPAARAPASSGSGASVRQQPATTPAESARASAEREGKRAAPPADTGAAAGNTAAPAPGRPAPIRHLATPDPVRGLYVNRLVAQGPGIWRLIDLARRTRVNALVFDVKDDDGLLLYPSTVGLARLIGADTVRPMPVRRLYALMDSLRKYRIYPIARIVVARDPVLAAHRPQWAVVRRANDPERSAWLDPRHREVWAYAADLASEAAARGFSEVLFDDARFPVSNGSSERVEFTSPDGRTLGEVIRAQLDFLRSRFSVLNIPMSVAVSGLAAVDSSDLGVGERWEAVADRADVLMPKEYPSVFPPGTFGLANPNAQPYETVRQALADARRRNASIRGAARIVPWYQDFTLGVPAYGPEQVRAQIRAGEEAGIRSWMLWNPASVYSEAAIVEPPVRHDSVKAKPRKPATKRLSARAGGRSRR
ncbi:MAG TPA: putative glycoside hydrolase [Gemmatimonadaceae bacterium]